MEDGKRPSLSPTDKRCFAILAGLLVAVTVVYEATDGAVLRQAEPVDRPPLTWEAPVKQVRLLEAITLQLEDPYRADIPLSRELQAVLREACAEHSVPVSLALGLIQEESRFDPDVVSSKGAYGLCQLNPKYFPDDLDPAGNIAAGVAWLGELLEQHGDTAAALRAYNLGWDDGDRVFSNAVLAAAERWEE